MAQANDVESQRDLSSQSNGKTNQRTVSNPPAATAFSTLAQRTCVFLHDVLKEVQTFMDKEVKEGGMTEGWKMAEIQTLLHTYIEACKDLELSGGVGAISDLEWSEHQKSVENEVKRTVKELRVYSVLSTTRNAQKIRDWESLLRWAIANLAGGAVVVPMIIMVLAIPQQKNLNAWPSVVVVVLATSGFATLIAWASSSSHQDLMVAVATYAAVLVVFVGTQTPQGLPSGSTGGTNSTVAS